MKKNKVLKVLTTSALLASVAAPFGAGVVSAATDNRVDIAPSNAADAKLLSTGKLTLQEDSDYKNDLKSNRTFTVTLPAGVEFERDNNGNLAFSTSDIVSVKNENGSAVNAAVEFIGDNTMDVTLPTLAADNQTTIDINFDNNIVNDDFDGGNVELAVSGTESGVTTGKYTIATIGAGDTTTTVLSTPTISESGTAGVIRIAENSKGAIENGDEVEVKLSSGFEWQSDMGSDDIKFTAGLQNATAYDVQKNGRTLTFKVNTTGASRTQPGTIQITPQVQTEDNDTKYGDITASISGDVSSSDVVIAKYADYGVELKADGDVAEVISGRIDEELTTIKVEETLKQSLLQGRKTTLELPEWVKPSDVKITNQRNISITPEYDGEDSEIDLRVTSRGNGTASFDIEIEASIKANAEGDIVAKFTGNAGMEGEVTIGKTVKPVALTGGEATGVKIGLKEQPIADLTITEAKSGAIQDDSEATSDDLIVRLPENVKWSDVPKVEVTQGDLEIEIDDLDTGNDDRDLIIPIKASSTKASTIKITGGKVTLDRTVPEGAVNASVRGGAIVENDKGQGTSALDAYEFDQASVASVKVADVITPAPGETTAYNVVFKLNSKTYTVDGKAQEMDAAPLVGWDRAYLPVRFAANALNVADEQIIWDDKTSTFTVFKGDRVITGKVGDKFLTVNGVKVPMDVPVWRNKAQTNNRVMVPIRYLSNALNAEITWNKETSEITIGVK